MDTNVVNIGKKVNRCGGVYYVKKELWKKEIHKLTEGFFPKRVKQAKYSYANIILNWIMLSLSGAKRLHQTKRFRSHVNAIPDFNCASPDQIGRIMKKLATPTQNLVNTSTVALIHHGGNQVNFNPVFNKLMIEMAIRLGMFPKNGYNILDLDATIIENEKYDSLPTYKKVRGYSPMMGLLNSIPIYVENRNGNTHPAYRILEALHYCIDVMRERGIPIHAVRMDAAGYQKEVLRYLNDQGIDFFIRKKKSKLLFQDAIDDGKWESVDIKGNVFNVCSLNENTFKEGNWYRVVIIKSLTEMLHEKDDTTDDKFVYRSIITNNKDLSAREVILLYHQRGTEERNFNQLNNLNMSRLPFSSLNENTVFIHLCCMALTIFKYLMVKFSEKLSFVKATDWLDKFIYNIIDQFFEIVIQNDKEKIAFYDNGRDYSPLLQ